MLQAAKTLTAQLNNFRQANFMSQLFWEQQYKKDSKTLCIKPDKTFVKEASLILNSENNPISAALDLGAGSGADSIWLSQQGLQVLAVDFAKSAISRLNKIAKSKQLSIETKTANILDFKTDRKFDFVFSCYLHLEPEKRKKLLAKVVDFLKPHGWFLYLSLDQPQDKGIADPIFAPLSAVLADFPEKLKIKKAKKQKALVALNSEESFLGDVIVIKALKK